MFLILILNVSAALGEHYRDKTRAPLQRTGLICSSTLMNTVMGFILFQEKMLINKHI